MMAVATVVLDACAPPGTEPAADENGLVLLPGFTSRVIARANEAVLGTDFQYRGFPDGAATFVDHEVAGGCYLVTNHEIPGSGGVTSIRFAPDGTITDAFSICHGTTLNCAGGATPWGTWLTGEEYDLGRIHECDPTGRRGQVQRDGLGAFAHEAAAVAPDGRVYLTEDRSDGGFYRFTPDRPEDLSSGLLEVATGAGAPGPVTWTEVPDPSSSNELARRQVPGMIEFDGGEGIDVMGDAVFFTTKGDRRIWRYDLATSAVEIRYQASPQGEGTMDAVDNLWVDDASSTLFVAEDGGNMELVALRPDDTLIVVARVVGQESSEVTGPCFSPDGQRLYFSSQRAPVGFFNTPFGMTYEVTGPFDELLGRTA
jgi:secreted PhoX family phosphatase